MANGHKKQAYLTKRDLVRSAAKAIRTAAARSLSLKGYLVEAQNGWIVKVYANGKIEKIHKLSPVKRPSKIALD